MFFFSFMSPYLKVIPEGLYWAHNSWLYLLACHAFLRIGEVTGPMPPKGNSLALGNIKFIFDWTNTLSAVEIHMSLFKHSSGKHIPVLLEPVWDRDSINPLKMEGVIGRRESFAFLRLHYPRKVFATMKCCVKSEYPPNLSK
jgi:hypothetical protein